MIYFLFHFCSNENAKMPRQETHQWSKIIPRFLWNIFRTAAVSGLDQFFGQRSTPNLDSGNKAVLRVHKNTKIECFLKCFLQHDECSFFLFLPLGPYGIYRQ